VPASDGLVREGAGPPAPPPAAGTTTPRAQRRKGRPLAFWLHNILGLKVSLFMAFVCLTGTIATVAHEIEWLYKPEVRATGYASGAEDWAAMWSAAQSAYPDATLTGIGSYDRTHVTHFAKSVGARDAAGEDFTIYVDPGTNRVTGHEYGRSLQDAMRALHYYLFVPGDVGFYLVTSLGFVLLASMITGLIVYKKFWRGFFTRPRLTRNLRTAMGDLHRLAGLWSLWFVAVIALTSVYYFFEWKWLDWERETPQVAVPQPFSAATSAQIERWVDLARTAKPGFRITAIHLPYGETEPAVVQGHWQAALVRERADAVYIDPARDRVIGLRSAHEMSVTERTVHTVDPLHFGTFGGLTTKLLWAVFGLILTGMAVSGAIIYAVRTRKALAELSPRGALDFLGRWKWPNLLLVSAVPAIAFVYW
jgi:uncharacterized iron-regulated membrane protein